MDGRDDSDEALPAEPYPGAARPETVVGWMRRLWPRLRRLVVHNILHLDDTPHRIALGVFWGFLVGATPTLGIQMPLYFLAAFLSRANKVSGIGPVWLTNPLTAVPIYYFNWKLGLFLLTGRFASSPESRDAIARLVEGVPGNDESFFTRIFSGSFWSAVGDLLATIGVELWVGSIVVGLVSGLLGYWGAYYGVIAYRRGLRSR